MMLIQRLDMPDHGPAGVAVDAPSRRQASLRNH